MEWMEEKKDVNAGDRCVEPCDGPTLRPRGAKKDPTHILGGYGQDDFIFALMDADAQFSFLTEQMSLRRGLKHFKKKGLEALMAEMSQLHYRKTIKPTFADSMTRQQKSQALRYLMFLKEKRCGRIKARGCADGRKQRLWKTKEETSSPTVRTHSLFLIAVIAALEGRKVVTVDIPGAFMQTDIDELIHVKLEDELVDVLLMVDNKYAEFVTHENGRKILYVELQKALYGTLQASLLFWKELSNFLVKELGFDFNPYDKCVVNKMVNGKQCTIIWHVDDLIEELTS